MQKIIFHIDMDSYFATVEQQANPFLRGKPIAVSGKEGSRTVIVASSREAKKMGVKTAMAHFEAKKMCPELFFVYPDGNKYSEITQRFISIFKSFTEVVEIYSIDEAFLDMTGHVKTFEQAHLVVVEIKAMLKDQVGEWVTCSVGISDNRLMAKLASGLDKPNGVVQIDDSNRIKILDGIDLEDICGIGSRIRRRLEAMGIPDMKKLRVHPLQSLITEFGPYYGKVLHDISFGRDDTPINSDFEEAEIKSAGRSYTFPRNTWDKKEIFQVLLHLSEKCGRQLRRKKLAGKTFQYYVRYDDFTHGGCRITTKGYHNDGLFVYTTGRDLLQGFRLKKPVRLVGVRVSNLVTYSLQLPLWKKERQRLLVLSALDKINDTYGELTIKQGYLADSKGLRKKVGGFKSDAN